VDVMATEEYLAGLKPAPVYLTREEQIRAVNMLHRDAPVSEAAQAAFTRVVDAIEIRALGRKKKPLDYEVHHEVAVARNAFLTEALAGGDMDSMEKEARIAVSLDERTAA
jgi:hypothetical protein